MRRLAKVLFAASVLLVAFGSAQALAAPPVATIDPTISNITYHGAEASGTVNPEDNDTYYSFEFSTDPLNAGWSGFTSLGPVSANSGAQPVSAPLTSLQPGTEYQVRLTVNNFVDPEVFSAEPNPTFTTVAAPTLDPVAPSALSLHLSGTVFPASAKTDYRFEISVDDGTPSWETFGAGSTESASPTAIETDRDLEADTNYLVRVSATTAGDTALSAEQSFSTTTLPPTVKAIPGSGRTTTEVRLNGTVNPNGLPTTYRFEYGTDTSYGTVIPASGPDFFGGTGTTMVRYSKLIQGLAPNTTIHYRLVAHNADGTSTSGDQTVTTLAHESAYEMVSPPVKNGAILLAPLHLNSSPDGDRVRFSSAGIFAGGTSAQGTSHYVAARDGANWQTTFIPLPQTTQNELKGGGSTNGFSSDLSHSFQFSNRALLPGAVAGQSNMYLKDLETGELEFVATFTNRRFGFLYLERIFIGGSPDGKRMFFQTPDALTPDAIPFDGSTNTDAYNIYEFAHGALTLISQMPNGAATLVGNLNNDAASPMAKNMVSQDASRVFFRNIDGKSGSSGSLYVREGQTTRLISASQRAGADPEVPVEVIAVWMSADGSAAYFTTLIGGGREPLTDDAPAPTSGLAEQLYGYDLETGDLSYIAPESAPGPADTNLVYQILGVSRDGSTVYFSERNTNGLSTPDGLPSNRIYVSRDGVTRFIGELGHAVQESVSNPVVSPNGDYFAFMALSKGSSFESLSTPTCAGCEQVYEYDYAADKLSCASCNPSGAPTGPGQLSVPTQMETSGAAPNRAIIDDGSVFFESSDRLVPEDTNEKQDVYRWSHGQLDLVSTGQSADDSFYGDVTPDGKSVFFFTYERLVSQDVDGVKDVYVKREGGGLAAQNQPPAETPCFGEGCLNKSPDPPDEVSPASNGFSGPANAKPSAQRKKARKCAKSVRARKAQRGKAKARCAKRSPHKANGGGK